MKDMFEVQEHSIELEVFQMTMRVMLKISQYLKQKVDQEDRG